MNTFATDLTELLVRNHKFVVTTGRRGETILDRNLVRVVVNGDQAVVISLALPGFATRWSATFNNAPPLVIEGTIVRAMADAK